MWTLLGDPALKIPFLEATLDVELKAEIGSSEVVVEFNVPEDLVGGTCELQVELRPSTDTRGFQQVNLAPPIVSSQQLDAKPRFNGTIQGLGPLAEGELRVRVFVIKDGSGALGVSSKSLKQN